MLHLLIKGGWGTHTWHILSRSAQSWVWGSQAVARGSFGWYWPQNCFTTWIFERLGSIVGLDRLNGQVPENKINPPPSATKTPVLCQRWSAWSRSVLLGCVLEFHHCSKLLDTWRLLRGHFFTTCNPYHDQYSPMQSTKQQKMVRVLAGLSDYPTFASIPMRQIIPYRQ